MDVMDLNIFDIIEAAYRSRLLFRTEEEYREITGVAYETIRDCKEDSDALAEYYGKLHNECLRQCGMPLDTIVEYYMKASDICIDVKSADSNGAAAGFDWMERDQLASRKKFCRWMFRKVSIPVRRMSIEEESKFKPKKSDPKLFDLFYPAGFEEERLYDLIFVMLITFGVVRPYTSDSKRGRDITDAEARRSCEAFRDLVETLREDTPQIGVLPKPMIFDITLKKLQGDTDDFRYYSVAEIWNMLDDIENACLAMASPQCAADAEVSMTGYSMPGIWVDDTDEGRSRFWIFPENKLMAFCYRSNGASWQLVPYEFVFFRSRNGYNLSDSCTFATAKGNYDMMNDTVGMTEASEIVNASYTKEASIDDGESFNKISFTIQSGNAPEWMDWHSFRKLDAADPLHARYLKVTKDIYDPQSLSQFILFENTGALLTDAMNSLIAVDNEYLYVSDMPRPERFILSCDKKDNYRFLYNPVFSTHPEVTGLRNAVISKEHPLYLLPRDFQEQKKHTDERKQLFEEACRNMNFGDQISIYRSERYKNGNLCFNKFSLLFSLDDGEIEKYGALRITDPVELFPLLVPKQKQD